MCNKPPATVPNYKSHVQMYNVTTKKKIYIYIYIYYIYYYMTLCTFSLKVNSKWNDQRKTLRPWEEDFQLS